MTSARKREYRFEIVAICVIVSFYCANRFLNLFDGLLPTAFTRNHFNDLCGGMLFPAYANVLLEVLKMPVRIDDYPKVIGLGLLCSFAWEVVAPLVLERSTADPIDACMYLIGGIIYVFARRLVLNTGLRGRAREK